MDYLTFIAKLIDALAWPIAIVIIVLLFKSQLKALLHKIGKFKYKDLELEFSKETKALQIEADKIFSPISVKANKELSLDELKSYLFSMSDKYPRAAIFEAWNSLEASLGKYAASYKHITEGEKIYAPVSYLNIAKMVFQDDDKHMSFFYSLWELRNRVVHESNFNPSTDNAKAFVRLTVRLIAEVQLREEPVNHRLHLDAATPRR